MLGIVAALWFLPEGRLVNHGIMAAVKVASTDPDVQRAAWTLVLAILGGIVTVATAVTVLWRIARPHVEGYVKRTVAPVARDVQDVREQVNPAGSGSSLAESAAEAVAAAARADRKLDHLAHVLRRIGSNVDSNTRRIEQLGERTDTVQTVLEEHVEEARGMVAALEDQGMKLPRRGDRPKGST